MLVCFSNVALSHLYALYCLYQREQSEANEELTPQEEKDRPLSPVSSDGSNGRTRPAPTIFRDPGWSVLNTSILSTSNCGNPALRLFGFGPVAADGFGIGYIIKEDGLSVAASSKHLQTRRFLHTLQGYLLDIQRMLVQVYLAANEPPTPFVDHSGFLRDAKTGMKISEDDNVEEDEQAVRECLSFSSGIFR
jgi:carnitine O-acetyltransferase